MDDLFKQIHLCDDQDKFICDLDHICHDISTSKRVVIIGALYPISIARSTFPIRTYPFFIKPSFSRLKAIPSWSGSIKVS